MRRLHNLLIIVLLTCSCSSDRVSRALLELDTVIAQAESYRGDFLDSLSRIRLQYQSAQTDSMRWTFASRLYSSFNSYSTDSTLFYLARMKEHVSNPRHMMQTRMADMHVRMVRKNDIETLDEYHMLDTAGLLSDIDLRKSYLQTGISLYHHVDKLQLLPRKEKEVKETLQSLRRLYINLDPEGSYSQKIMAQYERDNGDVESAQQRLVRLYEKETLPHMKAKAAYNVAMLYSNEENQDDRILWLVKSACNDFYCAGRDYLSLYELALILYDKGKYHKANKYLELNLSDAFSGNFNSRFINSGKAHVMVSGAERHNANNKLILMIILVSLLVMVLVGMILLLKYSFRQRRRIKQQRDMLYKMNNEVKQLNQNLHDANKIKENYMFRYMEMSVRYLERFDDFRNHIRSVAHSQGMDEVLKELRSRENIYHEYDNFYAVFDETFLGIYPDFVEKVNNLLREDARFPIPVNRVLKTELRILATIRLGITESGKIASFLKCAPPTVYTYRAKMRNSALCDKDEFETLVRQIQ